MTSIRGRNAAAAARAFLVVTVLAAAASCGTDGAEPDFGAPSADRIVSMAPNITETVFALGEGGRLAGVTDFCDYPPEAQNLPRVGGYLDPDKEKLTMLAPDLILIQGEHAEVEQLAKANGTPVVHVNMDSLGSIDAGIMTIGKALGVEPKADELVAQVNAGLDAVRAAVADLPRPKVLIITARTSHDLNNLYTVGGKSFVSELVDLAGGDNIYADAPETYFEASKETVVLQAPDAIVEFHAGETLTDEDKARFVADWNQLASLPAVEEGRIYIITESHALRPGPRVPEIAGALARLLHPDAGLSLP